MNHRPARIEHTEEHEFKYVPRSFPPFVMNRAEYFIEKFPGRFITVDLI